MPDGRTARPWSKHEEGLGNAGNRDLDHDRSNGWEAVAARFVTERSPQGVGAAEVAAWSRGLKPGAEVLDLGCGSGIPVSARLVEAGMKVFGVDAAPTMCAAFRANFPDMAVRCEPAESSDFFGRSFDAAVAWGLIFLLPPESQRALLRKVAAVLVPCGRFLFTAPAQECWWHDLSTGRGSVSLGSPVYHSELARAGLTVLGEYDDEGENHYYHCVKI